MYTKYIEEIEEWILKEKKCCRRFIKLIRPNVRVRVSVLYGSWSWIKYSAKETKTARKQIEM